MTDPYGPSDQPEGAAPATTPSTGGRDGQPAPGAAGQPAAASPSGPQPPMSAPPPGPAGNASSRGEAPVGAPGPYDVPPASAMTADASGLSYEAGAPGGDYHDDPPYGQAGTPAGSSDNPWARESAGAAQPVPAPGPAWQPGAPGPVGPGPGGLPLSAPPMSRRRGLTVLAVVVACVLIVTAAVQTVMLLRTNSALDRQGQSAAAAHHQDAKRIKALESTVSGLEDRVKKSLDPAAVAKKVLPSIFQVVAGNWTGSSFVIGSTDDGGSYLLTNDHVVQPLLDKGKSTVQLERGTSTFSAEVVKHDQSLDVAVLKADEKFTPLKSADKAAKPGEPVVVIGSPLGLNDSVTTGVVSSAQRDMPNSDESFIQFDAAINHGNSGGPVVNAAGEVVGIATAKAKDAEGIGLAIPISVPCGKYSVCG